MTENSLVGAAEVAESLINAFEGNDETYLINPPVEVLAELIDTIDIEEGPGFNVIAREDVLKSVSDNFLLAGRLMDLSMNGLMDIRSFSDKISQSYIVSTQKLKTILTVNGMYATIESVDVELRDELHDQVKVTWEDADDFDFRMPPMSAIHETLSDDISEETEATFGAMSAALETARGPTSLDKVETALLAAAVNEEQLYEISKWGEDIGLASKATFSRSKNRLEDLGLIDTTKITMDIGRPRLRLKLAHDELKGAEPEEVVSAAVSAIQS